MQFIQEVDLATKKIRALFPETPLEFSERLSKKYGAKIYLKREDLSPVRSYKIRGAFNFISQCTDEEKSCGIVCASAGNHAQGVAFSCTHFRIPGKIFMPVTTPAQKIEKTKCVGGKFVEIILTGDTFGEANTAALKYSKENNSTFAPPFDHKKIIVGGGTVAQEILNQSKSNIDLILAPVGGGGLSAGMINFFREQKNKPEIIAVEPEGAAGLYESLKQKKPTTLKQVDTFVDGCAVPRVGDNNFEILAKQLKTEIIKIPENRLCQTMLDFLFYEGMVTEPSGALSVDALKDLPPKQIKDKTIVCIISGGNFDFERLPEVKERAMKYAGLKKYFIIRMPQRPGALKDFLDLMGPEDDIVRFEYLKKSIRNFGSILLGIETKDAKNFPALLSKMKAKNFEYQDVTDDEVLADFVI